MNKENKIWRRKFIAFLKENGIYEKWIYNIKRQHPTSDIDWWNCFADTIYKFKSYDGINYAFYWADTKEGHEYWRYFNLRWKRIVGNGKIFQNVMTKEDKKWKRQFIAFLKENGIYEKWIYNMKRQHPTSDIDWWNLYFYRIYENKCSNGINWAFYWADTEEGYYYWSCYDRMWKYNCGVIRTL